MRRLVSFIIAASATLAGLASAATVTPTQRLLLFGGGDMPANAKAQFVQWAGGSASRILIISWSSGYTPAESLQSYREEFLPAGAGTVDVAPAREDVGANLNSILASLDSYTGIFFTGGDQNRTANLLDQYPALRLKLKDLYRRGIPFAGTSAGTAIMSKTMITGDGALSLIAPGNFPTREGLGLLESMIVDQHFIVRQRLNRLISVLMEHNESLAVGVDEGTSLALVNGCQGTVLGPTQVIVMHKTAPNAMHLEVVSPDQTVELCNKSAQ